MQHFYKSIQGWFSYLPLYQDMVQSARDGAHFVEVGSWKGKSSAFMAVEIANSGKKIKFDCVDTWLGSDEKAHHKDAAVQAGHLYELFLTNISPVEQYINPVRLPSVEAAALYEDASLDFVMIDAAHDYNNVLADLKAWLPKVKVGGVIAGDDYNWPGVKQAVAEVLSQVDVLGKDKGRHWAASV